MGLRSGALVSIALGTRTEGSRDPALTPSGGVHRFPLIVETLARLRSRSCIIDGEAVACDDNGVASFNLIRYRRHDDNTFLYAFDLIELNGDDLRRDPLEVRAYRGRRLDRVRPCSKASSRSARTRCIAPAA